MTENQVQEIKNYANEEIPENNYFDALTDGDIAKLDYAETVAEIDAEKNNDENRLSANRE
jgi:hypothetical protein